MGVNCQRNIQQIIKSSTQLSNNFQLYNVQNKVKKIVDIIIHTHTHTHTHTDVKKENGYGQTNPMKL